MNEEDKLRLIPQESVEDLTKRLERQHRAENLQRETRFENSVAPFKIGCVRYLNAVPLVRGIEDQIVFDVPSKLAQMLQKNELDTALVSVVEALSKDKYTILDGIAIACLGEVKSVLLAHRRPLEEVDVVYLDSASLTSVTLLKVLFAEKGLSPKYEVLKDYSEVEKCDYVLLIGDEALNYVYYKKPYDIWDLGAAWYELTHLPFVYAVWAIRKDVKNVERLIRILRGARDFGLDTLDSIISNRTEYDYDFRKDYLTWHIHYHLGSDERKGIARFIELIEKHRLFKVYPPNYVS